MTTLPDESGPPPSNIYTFTPHPSTIPFQVPADQHVLVLAQQQPPNIPDPIISFIAIGALTFHPGPPSPATISSHQHDSNNSSTPTSSPPPSTYEEKILLVQRSKSDSMPNRWEIPGGACDNDDPSILHSVARELYEEAGLTPRQIGPLVEMKVNWSRLRTRPLRHRVRADKNGDDITSNHTSAASDEKVEDFEDGEVPGYVFAVRSGKLVRKYNFIVEIDGIVAGEQEVNLNVDVDVDVKLDPAEHQNYVWATEEDVRKNQCGNVKLGFTSEEQKEVILNAFEVRREMMRKR